MSLKLVKSLGVQVARFDMGLDHKIDGDFMDIKPGDLLLLRNGKYQKNVLNIVVT